jgi:hypothetical protein
MRNTRPVGAVDGRRLAVRFGTLTASAAVGEWELLEVAAMADQQAESRRLSTRRDALNKRLRLAFISGAEERSRETVGRGLTDRELRRVMRRYPEDVTDLPGGPRAVISPDAPS